MRSAATAGLRRLAPWLGGREAGQGLVEYALIFLAIALLLIVIVGVIGHQTGNQYSDIRNSFPQ